MPKPLSSLRLTWTSRRGRGPVHGTACLAGQRPGNLEQGFRDLAGAKSKPGLADVAEPERKSPSRGSQNAIFAFACSSCITRPAMKQVEQLRAKYAPKTAALQERIRRAQQVVDKQREQSTQQKTQAGISIAATVLSALTGRKISSGRPWAGQTTAMRGVARSVSEQQDVGRARETVAALQKQLEDLESAVEAEVAELQAKYRSFYRSPGDRGCQAQKDERFCAIGDAWSGCPCGWTVWAELSPHGSRLVATGYYRGPLCSASAEGP